MCCAAGSRGELASASGRLCKRATRPCLALLMAGKYGVTAFVQFLLPERRVSRWNLITGARWPPAGALLRFPVRNAPQQTENGIAALGDEYAWHLGVGSSPRCVPIFFALGIPGSQCSAAAPLRRPR
ncbi:hypothetical protein MTO96_013540 [Rhipicephalus appendiculatus]